MNNLYGLSSILGWCALINVALILVMLVATALLPKDGFPFRMAASVFGITVDAVRETHFRVFMQYRVAVLMFNIVPYIALHLAREFSGSAV